MTAVIDSTPPYQDEFEEIGDDGTPTGFFSRAWLNFFNRTSTRLAASPRRFKRVTLAISAVIGITALPLGELSAGLYRVSWTTRIKTPAGVGSAFQLALGYTDGGVAQTILGDLLNTNTTTTKENGDALVRIDVGSSITYAVAYVSNPAAAMVAALDVIVEDLNG